MRKGLPTRLVALRAAAGRAVGSGARFPVTLRSDTRATVCSLDRASAVLADAAGAVSARRWDTLEREDVYRIYKACLGAPSVEDRLSLGLLCHVLGLATQARGEFDEAVRQDTGKQPDVDRFVALQLAR